MRDVFEVLAKPEVTVILSHHWHKSLVNDSEMVRLRELIEMIKGAPIDKADKEILIDYYRQDIAFHLRCYQKRIRTYERFLEGI